MNVNPFEVLLWLTKALHIHTLGQLAILTDLVIHFVSSSLPGWAAYSSMRYVLSRLFLRGGSQPGRTTWVGHCISLCSWGALFFASWLTHCLVDYGWSGFWEALRGL